MNKPNTLESIIPLSGQYSCKADLKLNAWLAVAAVLTVLSQYILRHHSDWIPPLRAGLALSPLIPCVLYARVFMKFIAGMDELQRRIQLQCWLIACVGALLIGTAINILNSNGIIISLFSHGRELMGPLMLTLGLWILSSVLANRRYK